ncbi:Fic/DOC family protein [uncultured archaeon]|nr:Fic/DOC family protein [uncultured archaeon]
MVYIYKKMVGGKSYYYLRASSRKGEKVSVKDIAYLGNSIAEAKESLSKLPKYKEKIDKAYRNIGLFVESNHFLEEAQNMKLKADPFLGEKLAEVEACRLHYSKFFGKQDPETKKEIFQNFLVNFALNTASIEGNTISLTEARDLLEEGLTPKGKTLREIYDLQNTEKVFNSLDFTKELSHEFIESMHDCLLENIDSRKAYRTRDIIVTRSRFKSTPGHLVKLDMDLLLKWFNGNRRKLHPFVLAAIFHHKFEKIHPFMDGNGRTGRMLLNFILMKNGYPPVIIRKKIRADYLDALSRVDSFFLDAAEPKQYLPLVKLVAQELTENYWNIFM